MKASVPTQRDQETPKIPRRTHERTGNVSAIAMGTWGIASGSYGKVTQEDAEKVIDHACEKGITLFDTSPMWGAQRLSESLVGRVSNEKNVQVISRLAVNADKRPLTADDIKTSLDESCKKLKRDIIDFLIVDPLALHTNADSLADLVAAQVENKKVRHWGLRVPYRTNLKPLDGISPDFVCSPANIFHADLFEHAINLDVPFWGHSPLLHGLFGGDWSTNKVFNPKDHRRRRWSEDAFSLRTKQANLLRTVLNAEIPTVASLAYRYLLSSTALQTLICGPRNTAQVDALLLDARNPTPLPPHIVDTVESLLAAAHI